MPVSHAAWIAIAAANPQPAAAVLSAYDQAVLERRTGQPGRAALLLEGWLQERPSDADARLHYGYALLDLGRLLEAEGAFRQVLQQAPTYADARIALARIAQRRGHVAEAKTLLEPLPANNAEATSLRQQLAAALGSRWQLDAGASASAVGDGQPDWRELSGQLRLQASEQTTLVGRIEATRRFGLGDVYGEVQAARQLSSGVSGYVVAGGTPRADYRPRWQAGGGISARLIAGRNQTVLTFDLRHSNYRSGSITTLQPGLEQYMLNGKAWVTGRLITLTERGRIHAGALGRVDVQVAPALRLFAGAADAPDTSVGVVTRVTSLFGGLEAAVSKRHNLRLSLARTNQEAGADRMEVAVGLGTRF